LRDSRKNFLLLYLSCSQPINRLNFFSKK